MYYFIAIINITRRKQPVVACHDDCSRTNEKSGSCLFYPEVNTSWNSTQSSSSQGNIRLCFLIPLLVVYRVYLQMRFGSWLFSSVCCCCCVVVVASFVTFTYSLTVFLKTANFCFAVFALIENPNNIKTTPIQLSVILCLQNTINFL